MHTDLTENRRYKKVDMTLFPFQMEVFKDPARFKVIAAGRRTGKSHLCCVAALQRATTRESSRIIMVGPTFGQAKEAFWTTLKTLCQPAWLDGGPREGDLELKFINGSRITLKGADRPDTLRGISPSPNMIICDEYAYFKAKVFEEVILPMTSDPVQKADVYIISTPRGIGNHFYKLWELGQSDDPKFADWNSWQFAAVDVRPDMAEEIERSRNTLDPRAFDQEYNAGFLNTGNAVFHQFKRRVHISNNLEDFLEGEAIHVAIDFNVSIMAAAAFALRGDQIHWLREFSGGANTDVLIEQINNEFPNRNIIVYPDASGRARKSSAATGVTDFTKLSDAGYAIRSRSKQPPIKDSVNAANRMLLDANGNTRMFFDSTLKGLLRSMEGTQWKENANSLDLDNATIDKSQGVEHYSDGVRYACEYLFPIGGSGIRVSRSRRF